MKKQLLSILLCLIMVVGLLPTAALAEEGAPAFDLATALEDIKIPDDLVTCICTTTNESKKYGQLTGGFSAYQPLMEDGVWTVIISINKSVYISQFSKDTGCEHKADPRYSTDFINPIQFKLKYEENKWVLEGEMPQNKTLHFTCSGGHVYQGDIPVIELVTRTHTDIKVTENDKWEYSIDNGNNWQKSCQFTNLQSGTKYTIIARVKETATHKPSANSEPLNVTTMHTGISDEVKGELRAVARAYKAEYDGMEHEAVIVDMTNMPEGWRIAGHTAGTGDDFVSQIPKIRNVSGSNLTVKTKFTHPDYVQSLIVYSYPEITPKPVTAGMIADIPSQHYTGHPIYPTPVIKDGNTVLVKDKDFTYSYDTNTSPEQGGKVTITGKGNYKGMASKSFNIVNEITEITEDDLKDLKIPTLVTVKCTTTNSSKEYGRIPGGFDLSKKPYMENGVWKAIVQLNLPAYKAKYDADTKKTHENAGVEGNPHMAFTLKYVNDKWEPDGNFPAVVLLVTCNGSHENQTYTVTFDGNGGRPTNSTMTTTGKKLASLPTATRSGRYSFDGWYTEKNGGTKITTATVFDKNTTVYAHWTYTGSTGGGVTTYPITVKSAKNGDVTASHKSAAKGTTITLTVDPDKGYVLDTLTVLDGKDKEIKLTEKNGKYTFTMPASKVTVAAMFKAEQSTGKNPFTDVPAGSYYEDAVIWAVDKGITTGTSATTFNPNGICTRAQAVTFLWRAAGSPAAKSSAMPFADVKAGSYYETAVLWAVENGITKGTSDTMFSPDATCTRAQIVTFLWRSQKSPAAGMANPFADVAADTYYIDAVLWAVKHNITVGTTFSIFSPDEECTRAQIVTFLYRAHNK
jgi:uncharacterized repeat protein (TIGR02543 family)